MVLIITPADARLIDVGDRHEWSAKGYGAWGAAATPRDHKASLFPGSNRSLSGRAELRCAFWSALERKHPDVVAVNGWNNFGSLVVANAGLRRRIPWSSCLRALRQDEPRNLVEGVIKRRIVGLYSAALVGGSVTSSISLNLGCARRVFTGTMWSIRLFWTAHAGIRNKRGLRELLSSLSAFHREEDLSTLIEAYAEYRRKSSPLPRLRRTRRSRERAVGSRGLG